ncbi:Uncharacterised protein [Mycobacterium tuberculosis]|nr:Uncharacterised protein [Mycobacterium tuberculosis]CMM70624.1 Uncharacterised protein [Mycobacterium tuberculosis]CMO23887.1 Uncharacterised protein [Mycobacterium tuberculosis]CMS17035.1 Uncharacterised protein [Mycobacterium tuberculosis]
MTGLTATPVGAVPTVMGEPVTVLVVGSITDTVLLSKLVTKTRPVTGLTATPLGPLPMVMGEPVTVLVAGLITDTVPLPKLVT